MVAAHLDDDSDASLRAALRVVAPELADESIVRSVTPKTPNSDWWSSSAVLGHHSIVKFAWSPVAARRLAVEGALLLILTRLTGELRLPQVVAVSEAPAIVITRVAAGRPLEVDDMARFDVRQLAAVADQIAQFLALLHEPSVLEAVRSRGVPVIEPQPQADTGALRNRLLALLDRDRAGLVAGWCTWVDEVLGGEVEHTVLVHGDLHGHNQVWDPGEWVLRAVVDFETAGPADHNFDFRYLPGQARELDLYLRVVDSYERHTRRRVDHSRVMAWHTRTVLGDALWRTEAGVPLPGGGTKESWIDELALRMAALGGL